MLFKNSRNQRFWNKTGINPENRMKSQFPLDNFFFAVVSVFVISPCPVLFSKFLSILRREIIVM